MLETKVKRGQKVKIPDKYVSGANDAYVISEVIFSNARSFIVRIENNKIFEVPKKEIVFLTKDEEKQLNWRPQNQARPKNKNKDKNIQHQNNNNTSNTNKPIDVLETDYVKHKRKSRKGNVNVTLVYIPSKDVGDEYHIYRKKDEPKNDAYEREFWALTHPFSGGGCSSK